jgi:transposase
MRAPKMNPAEDIWQYMRADWLSKRVFENLDRVIGAACEAWLKLARRPGTI